MEEFLKQLEGVVISFLSNTDLLMGIGIGFVFALVFFSVGLKDNWAIWLAQRENAPKWIVLVAGIGLLVFFLNVVGAILITLSKLTWEPWLFWVGGVSVLVLVVCAILIRRQASSKNSDPRTTAQTNVVSKTGFDWSKHVDTIES